jgi:hypothetical protein
MLRRRPAILALLGVMLLTILVASTGFAQHRNWWENWYGYEYRCRFGRWGDARLTIDRTQSPSFRPGHNDRDCTYWEGTLWIGNSSYPCRGYARYSSSPFGDRWCYFKVDGGYNWYGSGSMSRDLKRMEIRFGDYEYCYYDRADWRFWGDSQQ